MIRPVLHPAGGRPRRGGSRAAAAALLLPLVAGLAQPAGAQAVVQPIPDPAAGRLAEALQTLSREPNSLEALLTAGDAALRLNDLDAAVGFFARAEAVAPQNGRVKAGTATIVLRRDRPAEALRLFAEAEALGAPMAAYGADRGLAYDLVGDSTNAQVAYRLALGQGPDDEVTRRLAISQAIAGDKAGSEATLLPLLQRQDIAAYRARAFAMAILGEEDEAVSIIETMLPGRLSSRMAPYLRFMPRLTRAQQAAAANLGRFPPADEIGRGDAAAAASAAPPAAAAPAVPPPTTAQPTTGSGADARLVPSGDPMGVRRAAPPAQDPSPRVQPRSGGELPPIDSPAPSGIIPAPAPQAVAPPPSGGIGTPAAQPASAAPQPISPRPPGVIATPAAQPPSPAPREPVASPAAAAISHAAEARFPAEPVAARPVGSAGVSAGASAGARPASAPAPATPPPPESEPVDLATAFSDFTLDAPPAGAAAAGAVDITTIEPPRERPRPPSPPPPPPNPSRQWVQVATGRDAAALAFDWRRIRRQAGGLLDSAKPHLAAWGQSTRLLAGPFASAAEAQDAVTALKEKGVDSFRFTSAAGEEVRPLD